MRMRGEKKEIIHVISNRLLKWKKKKKKGQRGCSPSSPASFRQVPTTNMNSTRGLHPRHYSCHTTLCLFCMSISRLHDSKHHRHTPVYSANQDEGIRRRGV